MTTGDMVIYRRGADQGMMRDKRAGYGLITDIDGRYCWVFWSRLASDNFDGFKWCELKDLEVVCEGR